jgi:hypothetical protein
MITASGGAVERPQLRMLVVDGATATGVQSGRSVAMPHVETFAELAAWATGAGVDTLWIADGRLAALARDPAWWPADAYSAGDRPWRYRVAQTCGTGLRVQDGHDPAWSFAATSTAGLVATIRAIGTALDYPPSMAPATCGLDLLKEHLRRGQHVEPSPWSAPPQIRSTHLGFVRAVERSYGHVIRIDRNAAYLNAARSNAVGLGRPVEAPATAWDAAAFALWRLADVSMPAGTEHLSPMGQMWRGAWFPTPVLVQLDALGASFSVCAVQRWERRAYALRTWADRLVAARVELASRPDALRAVKGIANATIGMFNHRPKEADHRIPWHYRPEWRAHFVAIHALIFARLIRRLEDGGYPVLAAHEDAIVFLSDSPDVPECVELSERIGKYKLEQVLSGAAAREAQRLARKPRMSSAQWLEQVKGLVDDGTA